jgi:hypothetical protein
MEHGDGTIEFRLYRWIAGNGKIHFAEFVWVACGMIMLGNRWRYDYPANRGNQRYRKPSWPVHAGLLR